MVELAPAASLADLLAARPDPMIACLQQDWLTDLADIPDDAAPPLAMSGPHPRAVGSYGAECIAWAKAELGVTYRWWQQLAITRQLEHDESGALVWREVIDTGPRRIGKSVRLRGVALWRIANAARIGETQLAMLVSKDLAVGKEIHRGSWRWAEQPHKKEAGWKVTRLNGGQEVEAPDESRWLLRADTAVYGYDVGYGQVDESWGVDPTSITDGLEPALLERLWPQLHLTSTAHVKATSLMRRRLVGALRNATPEDVLLLMWGAPPGADLAAESTWRASSPHWSEDRRALIARKYAAALAGQDEPEFDDPDPVRGWAAQYLNVWPLLLGDQGSIFPNWDRLADPRLELEPVSLGIAADLDRRWYFIGAANNEGHVALMTPAAFDGPRIPAEDRNLFVREVKRISDELGTPVAIQEKGPAWPLKEDLELAGVPVTSIDLEGFAQGCADWRDDVAAGELRHGAQPELDRTIPAAQWRTPTESGRQIISRKTGDIAALESVIIARHARGVNLVPLATY